MGKKMILARGVNMFTLFDLIRKAAEYKGLKYKEGGERAYSEPIKEYILDDKLLSILAERGIKRQMRPDCRNEVFTLIDENPQKKVPGWAPSNYWNFDLPKEGEKKFNLRISILVGFSLNIEKRGFEICPQAHGTFLSPGDELPNFRMFKALVDNDKDAPAIAKELAASNGHITVTWTDLGLGGMRRIADLFEEFAGRKEVVMEIARRHEVFDPLPYRQNCLNPGDVVFVAEPVQPEVIQKWREQLGKYRAQLVA